MGSLYSICTKARLRCFRDWFSKLHDLQSLIEDRSSRLVNTVMDSSAREKEAAPKQDTGALIAIPEAFEMDALSTSRRRSNGFTPTAKAVSHWVSLPLVVIPDATAYNQLYVTTEMHLLKELYLNGKAYLTRWYLTLPPIVRTAIPMRYTTCNWYISGENRLFCANT